MSVFYHPTMRLALRTIFLRQKALRVAHCAPCWYVIRYLWIRPDWATVVCTLVA